MSNKIKLLTLSDHPLIASGVGIQTRYILEGLAKTGDYTIRSLGGAMRHENKQPVRVDPYGEDWMILPVDGYGTQEIVRGIIDQEQIDALWFMTDPRFYIWLFNMLDEVHARQVPVLYNHVWDEMPVPDFNKGYYMQCDFIGCISKLTYNIIDKLGMGHKAQYIPHAVQSDIFKPLYSNHSEKRSLKQQVLGPHQADKFVLFYNSRNARRKMTADVIWAFKGFLDAVGHDKAFLLMHTDPFDQEGPNLAAVAQMLGLTPQQITFSSKPLPPENIAMMYNAADVLVNISNNEGFGLSCLEALSCGTLALVNKTGGLSDQIEDDEGNVFGAGLEPDVLSIQGSQHIPYIYDARLSQAHIVKELVRLYKMPFAERRSLGLLARKWTLKRFCMDTLVSDWDKAIKFYVEQKKTQHKGVKVAAI